MFLMLITDFGLDRLLFDVVSAFGTVGLSTKITAQLPPIAQILLVLIRFIGRLGPITLASALALYAKPILDEYPKERPLIGQVEYFLTQEHRPDPGSGLGCVIGLGRIGGALARELADAGTEVLGIDTNEDVVQSFNGVLTHVVRADSTKEDALRQLSVHEFDRVVVGIGSDLEASILTTSILLRFEKPTLCAKAISQPHAEILRQLGVKNVVQPEQDMGKHVAHLVRGTMLDDVEFEDNFAMVKTRPPRGTWDQELGTTKIRARHGVTLVPVKRNNDEWDHTTLHNDDEIIVAGPTSKAEAFSALI